MSLVAKLEAALQANISINEKNIVDVKDIETTWTENCPVSKEDVAKLKTYRGEFAAAYHKVVGNAVVSHLKDNAEVSAIGHKFDSGDVEFGFDFVRPTSPDGVKLTKAAVRSTMSARVTVSGLKDSEKAVSKLADLWDF